MHRNFAKYWLKETHIRNPEYIKKQQESYFEDYFVRFGVLSLTAVPNNNDMWMKYSDNHKGFCIGFNPLKLFPFLRGGCNVTYYDELPIIYPTPKHTIEEQIHLQTFSKLSKWKFEEEYRTHKFSLIPLTEEQRKIVLPAEAFKEIILGEKMSADTKKEIIGPIKEFLPNVRIIEK